MPGDPIRQHSPGELIIALVAALAEAGIPSVYLRNYENLPREVGNDVDLLVPAGSRAKAVGVMTNAARPRGWDFLKTAQFSPIALYLANLETGETLHIDVFDRLEWHFIEFADAARILGNRRSHHAVQVPAPEDEIYLNLVTRLAYQGAIREKHRIAAREFVAKGGQEALRRAFTVHSGGAGEELFHKLLEQDWEPNAMNRKRLLSAIALSHGVQHPFRLMLGIWRYFIRTTLKIIHPPGCLIVLEGADGVGKSTILESVRPWCSEWCAGRAVYSFHWKPVRVSSRTNPSSSPVNPRGTGVRAWHSSLIFLAYHVMGFWWGWLSGIFPLLMRSHAVVGDRYSYDLFLDPTRFRLGLPSWICRLASLTAPKPTLAIGLVADPRRVHARKPELSVDEIANYQARWLSLSNGRPEMATVSADGPPEEVILEVKKAILNRISRNL